MTVALTLLALLIEVTVGYPDWLARAIGHPVTWVGRLIGTLDRTWNRPGRAANARRMLGVLGVLGCWPPPPLPGFCASNAPASKTGAETMPIFLAIRFALIRFPPLVNQAAIAWPGW